MCTQVHIWNSCFPVMKVIVVTLKCGFIKQNRSVREAFSLTDERKSILLSMIPVLWARRWKYVLFILICSKLSPLLLFFYKMPLMLMEKLHIKTHKAAFCSKNSCNADLMNRDWLKKFGVCVWEGEMESLLVLDAPSPCCFESVLVLFLNGLQVMCHICGTSLKQQLLLSDSCI